MSNVSNRHTVVPFIAGKSSALSGQRLSRCLYKPDRKTGIQKYPSVCVSVPELELELDEQTIEKLAPHILGLIEGAQDKILKSLYESGKGKLSSISNEDISLNACIAYLELEASGGRLTKEFLNAWFNENVQDNLAVVIAEKMGMSDPSEKDWEVVGKKVNGYRDMLSALSGGAVVYSVGQCSALLKALEIAGVDDDVNKKLVARLNNMMAPREIEELISLD